MRYLTHLIVAGLFFYLGFATRECSYKPEIENKQVDSIESKIEVKEKEVEVLKEKKKGISYTTKFKGFDPKTPEGHPKDSVEGYIIPTGGYIVPTDSDTMAQVIYTELLKCDSIVKIDSSIIAGLDTIISDQKEVISIVEADNAGLKKEVKKQKRKNLFTKIGAGIIIVAVLLLK